MQALRAGDAPRALQLADRALAATPRDASVRFTRGVILAEMRRDDEAIAVFAALIAGLSGAAEPYNNLAVLQARAWRRRPGARCAGSRVRNQPQLRDRA